MATRGAQHRGRVWTEDEVAADCESSADHFRERRGTTDSLDDYLEQFASAEAAAERVIGQLSEILSDPADKELLVDIVSNKELYTALRYLTAPPISDDDLATMLHRRPTTAALNEDEAYAGGLVTILRANLDPKRFPWVSSGERPTRSQLQAATLASAVAIAIQRVQTKRRGDEKSGLEGAVERMLTALEFQKVASPRENIENVEDLPAPGTYMSEVTLGGHNADFVIGLRDRRRLALECKSSNSGINSRKRLNKEVCSDAAAWAEQFGNQVVTGAALRGVFESRYVLEAQATPLLIFWSHRLEDLREFIEAAR